jgi:hypothetical protein
MPTPTVTAVAALIADLGHDTSYPGNAWRGWGTGGGESNTSLNERAVGTNSAAAIAGVLYSVLRTSSATLQVYKSTDAGATWATYGSAHTPTESGGGLTTLAIGTDLYVWYCRNTVRQGTNANSRFLFLAIFDTAGGTWGSEDSFDCSVDPVIGVSFQVEGPFVAHRRLDGSIALMIEESLGADPCVVTYDAGSWAGPFRLTAATFGTQQLYDCSVMEADGTINVFVTETPPYPTYWAVFHTDNSVSAPVLMSYTGQVIDWAGDGLYYGYESAGTFYLAAGKKTASYPTIWGRPAILYGNDGGGWTLGQLLDAGFDADFSVYSSSLQRVNGMLIYTWRGISSNGADFVERIGWAPEGNHDTPAAWTFTTAYDHRSPSPGVSGQTGPYKGGFPPWPSGCSTGLILDGNRVHFVTTLRDSTGELFSTYLLYVDVSGAVIVNDFRVGRAYFAQ